jgi:hypothetical protein
MDYGTICSGTALDGRLEYHHLLASRAFILAITTLATRGSLVSMLYAAHDYLWECWFLTGHNTFRSSLRMCGPGARRKTEQYYDHIYRYWCCVRGDGRRALPCILIIWYPDTLGASLLVRPQIPLSYRVLRGTTCAAGAAVNFVDRYVERRVTFVGGELEFPLG